jgi:5-bromo-4-chloroindolyl phosphate hydrolysis protein
VLLKRLLRNSFAGSFEAGCEGYRISKRVDRIVQTKVKKSLESEPVVVHFLPTPVNLVKEWHQMMTIPKIRKVSMI